MRASSPGLISFNGTPAGHFVARAKSSLVHSGLSSSKTTGGCLAFRGMAFHFLCMRTSKADRPVLPIADREDEAIGEAVDQSVTAITRFAVFETIIVDHCEDIEVDPARQRY